MNIHSQLGRRPILATGNSSGDREMLEWAAAGVGPTLALLVDHDDAQREYAPMPARAPPPPTTSRFAHVATRLGWTVASIAGDWGEPAHRVHHMLTEESISPHSPRPRTYSSM